MTTVLVVEDSSRVRPLIVRILESAGFVVLESSNAEQARKLAPRADLVLTDISLPDCSGLDLAQELRVLQPDLKFLFMSGFDVRLPAGHEFIEKPFQPEQLVSRIKVILQASE
jgi:DNA-binding response OmpR family regulator